MAKLATCQRGLCLLFTQQVLGRPRFGVGADEQSLWSQLAPEATPQRQQTMGYRFDLPSPVYVMPQTKTISLPIGPLPLLISSHVIT